MSRAIVVHALGQVKAIARRTIGPQKASTPSTGLCLPQQARESYGEELPPSAIPVNVRLTVRLLAQPVLSKTVVPTKR